MAKTQTETRRGRRRNPRPVDLGGRLFRVIEDSTAAHDLWFMGHVARAGLTQATMQAEESSEDFARRLLDEILATGKALTLIGGMLIPEDVADTDWTEEIAGETSQFLGGLTAERDKAQILSLVCTLLIDFFAAGVTSVVRTAGTSPAERPHPESAPTLGASSAPTDSANGHHSSLH